MSQIPGGTPHPSSQAPLPHPHHQPHLLGRPLTQHLPTGTQFVPSIPVQVSDDDDDDDDDDGFNGHEDKVEEDKDTTADAAAADDDEECCKTKRNRNKK